MRSIQSHTLASITCRKRNIVKTAFNTALAAAAMLAMGIQTGMAQTSQLKRSSVHETYRGGTARDGGVTTRTDEVSRTGSMGTTATKDIFGRDSVTAAHRQITDQHGIVPGSVY